MDISRFYTRIINALTFWIMPARLRRLIRNTLCGRTNISLKKVQNHLINYEDLKATQLIVMLIPEHNCMSGGIYSMFSIANNSERYTHIHNSNIVLMTRPNIKKETYIRQTNFKNHNIIYRFEQILAFENLDKLIIHIPEESAKTFYSLLSTKVKAHLGQINHVQINIMNQNIDLMPPKEDYIDLYEITNNITQTVAHHSYCSQEHANKSDLSTLLIPPYTDLSKYPKREFNKKNKMVLYSLDVNEYKDKILNKIREELPEYELLEIKDITFDKYMSLVTDSKFMITFGEGFDGYLAQSMLQGGIGFAVYNEGFFPQEFDNSKPNIFSSYEDMYENIVNRIKLFEKDSAIYKSTNDYFVDLQNKLYNFEDYLNCIKRFYEQDFDYYSQNTKKIMQGV